MKDANVKCPSSFSAMVGFDDNCNPSLQVLAPSYRSIHSLGGGTALHSNSILGRDNYWHWHGLLFWFQLHMVPILTAQAHKIYFNVNY